MSKSPESKCDTIIAGVSLNEYLDCTEDDFLPLAKENAILFDVK